MALDDTIHLTDETLRDGSQSLWGMMMSYHMIEPVVGEIGEAGYATIDVPPNVATILVSTRFFHEDPRILHNMIREKLANTKSNVIMSGLSTQVSVSAPPENSTVVRMHYEQFKAWVPQFNEAMFIMCTQDELARSAPIMFPLWRKMGVEPIPYLSIGHAPRHNEAYYVSVVEELLEKYQPKRIVIKDVDGLMVPERLRRLVPAMQAVADGTPLELHSHGMNGLHNYNMVVCMELGMRHFTTCIPPLANDSSHPSVFDVVNNAEQMGLKHNMDLDKLRVVEERLTKIGKAYGHPVDNHPLPFNLFTYKHQIPGGVISNTRTQLEQLGIPEKLDEVLNEIPPILEDLGYPMMITPFSQFIVTQAVLNVQLGRWEQCLDSCVDLAAGLFGVEDPGVDNMKPEIKDKLLSQPAAKAAIEKASKLHEYMNSAPSEAEVKASVGLPADASTEDFVLRYQLRTDDELNNCTPGGPETYKKYL